jgi:prepilin-type N-terminal cleavage/methylation domain-containing protein
MRWRSRGGFTLIELMVVVAIIGILAAVAIPAFMKNSRKAKTTEAVTNVEKIYDGAKAYFYEDLSTRGSSAILSKQFPDSGAVMMPHNPAPALGTCCLAAGHKCAPNPLLWNDAGWEALKFSMDDPYYYSYAFKSAGVDQNASFAATAYGDLDCDSTYSTFEMVGSVQVDNTIAGQGGFFKDLELE